MIWPRCTRRGPLLVGEAGMAEADGRATTGRRARLRRLGGLPRTARGRRLRRRPRPRPPSVGPSARPGAAEGLAHPQAEPLEQPGHALRPHLEAVALVELRELL